MTALRFNHTGRCPVAAGCISCGATATGARSITACPAGRDTYGAPAGRLCEPWCASRAAEPRAWPARSRHRRHPVRHALHDALLGMLAAGRLPRLTAAAAMRLVIEQREHATASR